MKGHHAYPPDEFDAAAQEERPRGVHRAPRTWWSRWGALVAVLVVFPLLAFGVVTWLSGWDGLQQDGTAVDQPQAEVPTDAGATEPDAEATDGAGQPVEESPTAEPTPEAPAAPEPDLTAPVAVLNATGTSGLAAEAAGVLEDAGFTSLTTGNWPQQDPPASVVLYADPADEGTAGEVAAALGITGVQLSEAVEDVTAVLWTDYVAP
ncbi:LytR C-terminal domain-containing protein [Actinotalea sp. Marseille-Q4924]|uniref:LytR C-terminal domain-containing protein n=1 Tax=Actinotalea sp. Marseille-Q4924 TaxID=2866571 RepID=UPI001CE3D913|nr:LytR C-terminal domain-containing protein [Actinotalea sp. Marseille-Q4924]